MDIDEHGWGTFTCFANDVQVWVKVHETTETPVTSDGAEEGEFRWSHLFNSDDECVSRHMKKMCRLPDIGGFSPLPGMMFALYHCNSHVLAKVMDMNPKRSYSSPATWHDTTTRLCFWLTSKLPV